LTQVYHYITTGKEEKFRINIGFDISTVCTYIDIIIYSIHARETIWHAPVYRTKHMITILRYITLQVRQSDDPDFKDELDLDVNTLELMNTDEFFIKNHPMCEISDDLMHQVFNFPLAKLLNHGWKHDDEEPVLFFLFFHFFPFVRRMVRFISSDFHPK